MSKARRHRHRQSQSTITSSPPSAAPAVSVPLNRFSLVPTFFSQLTVWFMYVLMIVVPLFFYWGNEELFEFNKMMLTYALTVLVSGTWFAHQILTRQFKLHVPTLAIPLLIFVLSQMASTLFSIHVPTSLFGYYTRFHGGLLSTFTYTALFFIFIMSVRKRELSGWWLATLATALVVSLYGIFEHFGYSISCLMITGKLDTACWVQDVQSRVFATFGQPNWLAAYVITLLPSSLVLSLWPQALPQNRFPQLVRWLAAVTSLAMFSVLLHTQSRSGIVGLAVGLLVLAGGGLLALTAHPKRLLKPIKLASGLILSLILLLVWFGTPWTPQLSELIASPTPTESTANSDSPSDPVVPTPANRLDIGGTDSGEIRKIVWQGAWDVWKRYPILGSGVETFAYSYYLDRPLAHNLVSEWDFLYNKAHNEFLNFLATTGLVGFLAYTGWLLSAIGTILLSAWRIRQDKPEEALFFTSLSSGLIALSISNFFGFSTVMVSVLLFLYPAIWYVMSRPELDPAVKERRSITQGFAFEHLSWLQWLGFATVTLSVFFALARLYQFWNADVTYATGKQYIRAGYAADGVNLVQQAIIMAPQEALYYDELAMAMGILATQYAPTQATVAGQLTQTAIQASSTALNLNPHHLNFHKTRARLFITLSQVDASYLIEAEKALQSALTLAPTDAKIIYNLGLVQSNLNQPTAAIATYEKAIAMKANYEAARFALGQEYEKAGNIPAAVAQYRYILEQITPGNTQVQQELARLTGASPSAQPAISPTAN